MARLQRVLGVPHRPRTPTSTPVIITAQDRGCTSPCTHSGTPGSCTATPPHQHRSCVAIGAWLPALLSPGWMGPSPRPAAYLERGGDDGVDVLNGLQHTLAQVPGGGTDVDANEGNEVGPRGVGRGGEVWTWRRGRRLLATRGRDSDKAMRPFALALAAHCTQGCISQCAHLPHPPLPPLAL